MFSSFHSKQDIYLLRQNKQDTNPLLQSFTGKNKGAKHQFCLYILVFSGIFFILLFEISQNISTTKHNEHNKT